MRFKLFAAICFLTLLPHAKAYAEGIPGYVPSAQTAAAKERFRDDRLGVFIHWGLYSMVAHGEWVMYQEKIPYPEYATLAGAFYPSRFDADAWVRSIKESGARYITFTTRHHDGFSLFRTQASTFNVIDATPFGRDPLKEIAAACQREGMTLNLYYSLLDWGRSDYPRRPDADYSHYLDFMCAQLTELLTNYGPIGCIWFDGDWAKNHKPNPGEEPEVTFDWGYERLYSLIHTLQPGCLIANNHHRIPVPGEDIQVFEQDIPGESKSVDNSRHISDALALETCKTMNENWGYTIKDDKWKSVPELIRLLVSTAGRNANLLLNIGPRPDGTIPEASLERLSSIGEWMNVNGETVRGTRATLLSPQSWGVLTHKEGHLYLHVMERPEDGVISLPLEVKARKVTAFATGTPLSYTASRTEFSITVPSDADCSTDYIIDVWTM